MALVLLLDHRPADRELLATVLGHLGHRILEAGDGETALARAREHEPGLVITDILMPGMDGYEFVRRLREDPEVSQPPVVFCTATYLAGEAHELARACGVSHVISKPAEPQLIIDTVSDALGTRPSPLPEPAEEFDRGHLRVLNQKLYDKVTELEEANQERRKLLADLVRAQECERQRIASDIHDDSIQVMSAAGMRLDLLARRLATQEDSQAIESVAGSVQKAVLRLRRLTFDLCPRSLDTDRLGTALTTYLREVAPDADLQWSVDDGSGSAVPVETKVILYRVAQEAIRNACKHSEAERLGVALAERDGGVALTVEDDGCGFDVDDACSYRPGHLGLTSMRERVEMAGGHLVLTSKPGRGAKVDAWIPGIPAATESEMSPSRSRPDMEVVDLGR